MYTTSPENADDVEQYGVNYRLPLYSARAFMSAFYTASDVDSGQVGDFDVSGSGEFWGVYFNRVLLKRGRYSHEWSVGFQDRLFENDINFGPRNIPLGIDVRSNPVTAGYSGAYRAEKWQGGFRVNYSRNIGIGKHNNGSTYAAVRAGAESDWDAWRGDAQFVYTLPRGWQTRLRMNGQLTDEPLISGEQFGLGGERTVRGLDERVVIGDSGLALSLEAWTPAWPQLHGVRLLAFVDVGHMDRQEPLPGEVNSDTVSSAGLGARWDWHNYLSVSLDYGHTLAEGEGLTALTRDERGVKWHFNVFLRF
jgi:hemolysin activation/secretion protein